MNTALKILKAVKALGLFILMIFWGYFSWCLIGFGALSAIKGYTTYGLSVAGSGWYLLALVSAGIGAMMLDSVHNDVSTLGQPKKSERLDPYFNQDSLL